MLIKRIVEEDTIGSEQIEQFNKYLTLMETETRRTSRIVSNLLAFSRQSKMEPKRLSINQLIDKTLFLNSNLLKMDGVKVETQLDPDLPDLLGSEDQLQQVFMNLVSNASETMGGGRGGGMGGGRGGGMGGGPPGGMGGGRGGGMGGDMASMMSQMVCSAFKGEERRRRRRKRRMKFALYLL